MTMIDMRKLNNDELFQIRKQVVRLKEQGRKGSEIQEIVGIYQTKISAIWKMYKAGGTEGLRPMVSGRKPETYTILTKDEEEAIKEKIAKHAPDQLDFEFALWTRQSVGALIEREYGKEMSRQSLSNYLKKWGFTSQVPAKQAYKRDEAKVKAFMETDYPAIAKQAKKEGAQVFWGDETGINNEPYKARGYSPKGVTPVLKFEAKFEKINMISAISNAGSLRFMCYEKTMTQQLLIEFMRRLVKTNEQKIFLILDNLKVHHGKLVQKWLEEHKKEIRVFYLPPYAPDRNPDEYLNNALKQNIHSGKPPRRKEELKDRTHNYMRFLQRSKQRVQAFFKHQKLSYQLSTV